MKNRVAWGVPVALGVLGAMATVVLAVDGDLDTTFDADGTVFASMGGGWTQPRGMLVQADGKIVLTGDSSDSFAAVRFSSDGSIDTSFDSDGKVFVDVSPGEDVGFAAALQPDGKIVMAGAAGYSIGVVRLNSDGSLDTSFDSDGKVVTDVSGGHSAGYAVAVQSDGKIVVAGYNDDVGTDQNFAVVRYNTDGSLDTSFDSDGKVVTHAGSSVEYTSSIAIQPDGKIVVVGMSSLSSYDIVVLRYDSNGWLDTSFDTDGIVVTDVAGWNDAANSVALQSDGKIVVAGDTYNSSLNRNVFMAVRYNTNGSLDTSFDSDGVATTAIGTQWDTAYSVAVQDDGKLVLAGVKYWPSWASSDFAITRFNGDGSIDSGFGTSGKVVIAVGTSGESAAKLVALQSDGKILVSGYANNGAGHDYALLRLAGTNPAQSSSTTVPAAAGLPVQSLAGSLVDGTPRAIRLTFNAPSDASVNTLSGYLVQYRCLTKLTAVAPCTGKWRSIDFYEVADDGSHPSNYAMTLDYVLPVGTGGRQVAVRVTPVRDDDDGTPGESRAVNLNVRDVPDLVATPLATSSTAKKRITVRIPSNVIADTLGSGDYSYSVKYTRNNQTWFTVAAPAGGWVPGASNRVVVNGSGVRYFFKLVITTNAGVKTAPMKAQYSR